MTDMDAFDRLIAREVVRASAPPRPVDDLAIFESVAAAGRTRRWEFTMFSALKLIAAGVIVALFGGFLLAGALTTPQADETLPAAPASPTVSPNTSASSLTLTVTDLVGMVGLEVASDLLPEDGPWGPSLLASVIHRSPATVSASSVLEPGRYFVTIYAGKPPCEVRFVPWCGGGEPDSQVPEFECITQLDVEPGEVIDVRITGLPRYESGADVVPACPVASLLRHGA